MEKAPAKIILFGEHFVVHGSYSIGCSIDRHMEVEVKKADKLSIIFNDEVVVKGKAMQAVINVFDELKLSKNVSVKATSNIPRKAGLGSSAAFSVALVREINQKYDLNLDNKKINELSYLAEKAFHGRPSGIDNTLCNFGGLRLFWKDTTTEKLNFEEILPAKPIKLVVVNTGTRASTIKMVEKEREYSNHNEEKFKGYLAEVNSIVEDAKDAITEGNLKKLGELMLMNEGFLEKIGVSTKEISRIITSSMNKGAIGGKLTGGGGGGCVILLYDKDEVKDKILENLKDFECFLTTVG